MADLVKHSERQLRRKIASEFRNLDEEKTKVLLDDYLTAIKSASKFVEKYAKKKMTVVGNIILHLLKTHSLNVPQEVEKKYVGSYNHAMNSLASSIQRGDMEATASIAKTAYNAVMPDITLSGIAAAAALHNPILGIGMDVVGGMMDKRKQANSELEGAVSTTDTKELNNPEEPKRPVGRPKGSKNGSGVGRGGNAALRDAMLINNKLLMTLVDITNSVWGESNDNLKALLQSSEESIKVLEEQQAAERKARFEKIEQQREKPELQVPEVQNDVPELAEQESEFFGNVFSGFLGKFSGFFASLGAGILAFANKIPGAGFVKKIFGFAKTIPGLGVIISVVSALFSAFDDDSIKSLTGKDTVSIGDRIAMGISGLVSWIGSTIDWLTSIFGFKTDLEGGIERGIFAIKDGLVGWVMGMWTGITEYFANTSPSEMLNDVIAGIMNLTLAPFKLLLTGIDFISQKLFDFSITDVMEEKTTALMEKVNSIADVISDFMGSAVDWVKEKISSLFDVDAIGDNLSAKWEDFKGMFSFGGDDEVQPTKRQDNVDSGKMLTRQIKEEKVQEAEARGHQANVNVVNQNSQQTVVNNKTQHNKVTRQPFNIERSFAFSN